MSLVKFHDHDDGRELATPCAGVTINAAIKSCLARSRKVKKDVLLTHNGRQYLICHNSIEQTIMYAFEYGARYALENGHS